MRSQPFRGHSLNDLTAFVLSPDESGIGLWESTAPPISKFPSIIELSMEVAAIHRRVDIVARILANSANSWTPDLSSSIIQSTICCDSWAVLKTLLEAGWDAGQCLCIAAECDSASAIKVILEAGFSVDTMHHGRTALQMAIRRKNHYAIMTLLEAGSDVALLTELYYSEPTGMFVDVLIEDMRTIRQMYERPSWRIQYKKQPESLEYGQYHFLVSHVGFQSELKFSLLTENSVKLGRKIRDKNCLGFSSDGNYLAFCYEGAVDIFNLTGKRTKRVTFEPTLCYITSICFVPGTTYFVIGGQNGRIYLCDITGSFRRAFLPRVAEGVDYQSISCLEISHDGTQLAAGCSDGKVRFWNIDNGAHYQTIVGSQDAVAVESLAFSPEGQYFAVGTGTSSCAFSTLNQLHTSYHGNFNTPMSRIQFPSFLMEQDSSLVPDTAARHFIT